MEVRRIDLLIQYLEKLRDTEPEVFGLARWFSGPTRELVDLAKEVWPKRYKEGKTLGCGTVACVAGHLPVLFPEDWAWTEIRREYGAYAHVMRVGADNWFNTEVCIARYFGGFTSEWCQVMYKHYYAHTTVPTLEDVLIRIRAIRARVFGDVKHTRVDF